MTTIGIEELDALEKRVQEATGPDRGLDGALWCALEWTRDNTDADLMRMVEAGEWEAALNLVHQGWRDGSMVPPLTASLDAALALVERVLPAWFGIYIALEFGGGPDRTYPSVTGKFTVELSHNPAVTSPHVNGHGATPALALLSALIAALRAKAGA